MCPVSLRDSIVEGECRKVIGGHGSERKLVSRAKIPFTENAVA